MACLSPDGKKIASREQIVMEFCDRTDCGIHSANHVAPDVTIPRGDSATEESEGRSEEHIVNNFKISGHHRIWRIAQHLPLLQLGVPPRRPAQSKSIVPVGASRDDELIVINRQSPRLIFVKITGEWLQKRPPGISVPARNGVDRLATDLCEWAGRDQFIVVHD